MWRKIFVKDFYSSIVLLFISGGASSLILGAQYIIKTQILGAHAQFIIKTQILGAQMRTQLQPPWNLWYVGTWSTINLVLNNCIWKQNISFRIWCSKRLVVFNSMNCQWSDIIRAPITQVQEFPLNLSTFRGPLFDLSILWKKLFYQHCLENFDCLNLSNYASCRVIYDKLLQISEYVKEDFELASSKKQG